MLTDEHLAGFELWARRIRARNTADGYSRALRRWLREGGQDIALAAADLTPGGGRILIAAAALLVKYMRLHNIEPPACLVTDVKIELQKTTHAPPVRLSRDHIRAIYDYLRANASEIDLLAFSLIYGAGLRRHELVTLCVDNVDLSKGAELLRVFGKGNRWREVPIPALTTYAIARWLDVRKRVPGSSVTPALLLGPRGGPYDSKCRSLIAHLAAAFELIGITWDPRPLHAIRHAYATHLYDDGATLRELQLLLGHARVETTCIYIGVSVERLHEAVRSHHSWATAAPAKTKFLEVV